MIKKEVGIILFLATLVLLLIIAGCTRNDGCDDPAELIDGICCVDADDNDICDNGIDRCGDNNCTGTEDCKTCWKDCGACKKIVYVYVPRNFTLGELTNELNDMMSDGVKFKKDITALNNVSNFFYHNRPTSQHVADFMGIKYELLLNSRFIVLNHVMPEAYYINDSDSFLKFINITNWHRIHRIKADETFNYEKRINAGESLKDYPTQPTGYQKEFRYAEWEFRNYTKSEEVVLDKVTLLEEDIAEAVYSSIASYQITYKSSTFYTDKDDTDAPILEDFRIVEEVKLTNIHTLNVRCSRNLVISIYSFEYDKDFYKINSADLLKQAAITRASLLLHASRIKNLCNSEHKSEIFTYT